jgi:Tol biopolymer transport system component
MGHVYRATDTTLGRQVAIKILPDAFAADLERLARFEREARTLASLNHPHIAAIYGFEKSSGLHALVMELVEGEDLSQRVARGAIPIDDALPIAKQIAEALEAAHEQGIIHRDLKPANIKCTANGTVKILDFGLAKVVEEPRSNPALTNSPTMLGASLPGVILGTVAYMSPEQANGKGVDRTSDVWAFGCVLYEMLTGRPTFAGGTVSEVLAEVLKTEPDWSRLPADTPEPVRRLLRRALSKDRKHRLQHMGDARIELEETLRGQEVRVPRAGVQWIAWSAAALALLIAVGLGVRAFRSDTPRPREVRLEVTTPPASDTGSFALSPDGQAIVFEGTAQGRTQLWVRPLNELTFSGLASTAGASLPFWSPDGRSIGFFADGRLKRLDLDTGSIQTLATAFNPSGGTWNTEGVILFSSSPTGPIERIAESGGEPVAVTQLAPQHSGHGYPQFLPDGRHFLYHALGGAKTRGVHVGVLGDLASRRLFDADSVAAYASSGHLLFKRQTTLVAQPFDPQRIELTGNPFALVEQLAAGTFLFGMATSPAGPIAYRSDSGGFERQLAWFDRAGRELSRVGEPLESLINLAMSPDGRRVAVQRIVSGNNDIWLLQTQSGASVRFTSDPLNQVRPVWSPDGSRIVFGSSRQESIDLVWKSATGGDTAEPLVTSPHIKSATDWSRDGQFLLYRVASPKTGFDVWALPMTGERKPFALLETEFDEREAQFSPDGKWIAYQSNESGRFEIYVQAFPGLGRKWPISTQGGAQVRWRADGRELFYLALDGRLMAVSVDLAADGRDVEAGAPVPLFITRVGNPVPAIDGQQYIVTPDGQRFLMNTLTDEAASGSIVVILNMQDPAR